LDASAGAGAERRRPPVLVIVLAFLAALGIAVSVLLFLTRVNESAPTEGSADAGFARDMGEHHAQAVDMSFTLLSKSPASDMETLAYDIANTQSTQRGMLMGWLQQWELPQTTSREPMQWMSLLSDSHEHPTDSAGDPRMPGMATRAQLDELAAASGVDAERLYLSLMIAHHQAGIEMAQGIVELSSRPEVRRLAQSMVDGQTSEIALMESLLDARGGAL